MAGRATSKTPASHDGEVAIISFVRAYTLRIVAAGACLAVLIEGTGSASWRAFREDTESDLLPRIEREHDPVKRAKLETRLAHIKLLRGVEACEKDDDAACRQFMTAYLDLTRSSWKDLQGSGRNAVKQPAGFKELDIALRENIRELDDAKRKIALEDRDAIEPVIQQLEKLHEEVLAALFPSGVARPAEKKPPPPPETHFVAGRLE